MSLLYLIDSLTDDRHKELVMLQYILFAEELAAIVYGINLLMEFFQKLGQQVVLRYATDKI